MVKITSLGICTGLGIGYNENISNLNSALNCFKKAQYLQTRHDLPVAEVPLSTATLASLLGVNTPHITRTTLLGILALKEALSTFPENYFKNKRVAFINSTTGGVMSEVELYYDEFVDSNPIDTKFEAIIDEIDATAVTYSIAEYFDIKGYITTISTACSSSANAILVGANLIKSGMYDIAICGGTDALTQYALNGFYSLKNIDKELSRPFDKYRNGINLGEGAGYIILEKDTSDTPSIALYIGGANTNEAHHPSAPDMEGKGALLTMKEALNDAQLTTADIAYINTHGTATFANDIAELNAIQQLFEAKYPHFNSTKAFTGHTLAASGVVEVILSIGMMHNNFIAPMPRFNSPMDNAKISPVTKLISPVTFTNFMSNSFGFGGSNVCLIIGK